MMRYVLFALAILTGGCASTDAARIRAHIEESAQEKTRARVKEAFTPVLAHELVAIPVTTVPAIAWWRTLLTGDERMAGYYTTLIVWEEIVLRRDLADDLRLVTHEFLHRVWYRNLSIAHRAAFKSDLDLAVATPAYAPFAAYVRKEWEDEHWMNRLVWSSEIFCEVGELLVIEERTHIVPPIVARHYVGILNAVTPSIPPRPP